MNIPARIKAVRLRIGDTQAACAKRAKMAQGQWADLEDGRYSPRIDTLQRVAKALKCPVAELIG